MTGCDEKLTLGKKQFIQKCQSVDAEVEKVKTSPRPAEYTSPGHSRDKKLKDFKAKKTTFARSVESGQWKEAALQTMSSKELVDHLEGLRNTVKRLQHSTFSVTLEEDVSCG